MGLRKVAAKGAASALQLEASPGLFFSLPNFLPWFPRIVVVVCFFFNYKGDFFKKNKKEKYRFNFKFCQTIKFSNETNGD